MLRADIVLKDEAVGRETDVERKLRELFEKDMSEFYRLTYYEFIKELSLTASGKVDYRKLEEIYGA